MGDRDFEFIYVEIFKIAFFMKLLTKELNFLVIWSGSLSWMKLVLLPFTFRLVDC